MTHGGGPLAPVIERLSTHVLDTGVGRPAAGVPVVLTGADGVVLGTGTTDADGRVDRLNAEPLTPGDVALSFDVAAHAADTHGTVFHPRITVHARLDGGRAHYHLPVLVSPFAVTTYLGS